MTDDELNQIEAYVNAATPGPWSYTRVPQLPRVRQNDDGTCVGLLIADCLNDNIELQAPFNAQFIARIRTDEPLLIKELALYKKALQNMAVDLATLENETDTRKKYGYLDKDTPEVLVQEYLEVAEKEI